MSAPRVPEGFARGRLGYARITADHAAELAMLMGEPRVRRTLWPWPEPPGPPDVQETVDTLTDHWARHGFGLWALHDATTGQFVGRGGLEYNDIEGASVVEVAWAIMPARWGEGLATELARVSVQMAFERLDLIELVAITMPGNLASRRVMEKSGFSYHRNIAHAGLEHVLYLQRAPTGPPAGRAGGDCSAAGAPGPGRENEPYGRFLDQAGAVPGAPGLSGPPSRPARRPAEPSEPTEPAEPAEPGATLRENTPPAPLTRPREARKEQVASPNGRPRPR